MTTKPKTHKAPAKAAAPGRPRKQTPGEQKREVTDIRKLVSRWHWLEADQTYRAKKAKTEKESERLIAIHNDEQSDIEGLLAHAVPKSFLDACCLLEFATVMVDEGGTPDGFVRRIFSMPARCVRPPFHCPTRGAGPLSHS